MFFNQFLEDCDSPLRATSIITYKCIPEMYWAQLLTFVRKLCTGQATVISHFSALQRRRNDKKNHLRWPTLYRYRVILYRRASSCSHGYSKVKSTVRVYLIRSKAFLPNVKNTKRWSTFTRVHACGYTRGKRKHIPSGWKRSPEATIHRRRRVFMRNKPRTF